MLVTWMNVFVLWILLPVEGSGYVYLKLLEQPLFKGFGSLVNAIGIPA